jgi:hypothetical protein
MLRWLELALLGISLVAVGAILYGYYRSARERRKAAEHKEMESDLSDYLKNKRKE